MITDNYCDEYNQRLTDELIMLMHNHTPTYNRIDKNDNQKVTISIDGLFPRVFSCIETAVRILKRENNEYKYKKKIHTGAAR